MTRSTPPRPLRGWLLAGFSALLTAVGHLAAGGSLGDLGILVVLLPALAYALVEVAQRCAGPAGTIGLLGGGQLVLHELMVVLGSHHPPVGPRVDNGLAMIAGHAAATLVVFLALRYADRGVAAVGAALRRVVARRVAPGPVGQLGPVRVLPGPAVPARVGRALAVTHVRRGPPVRC